MFELTTGKLVLLVVILILLFGAKRIPDLARSIGESIHLLKKGINDGGEDEKNKKK